MFLTLLPTLKKEKYNIAYVKIKNIKSGTHLQQKIDYIQNPDKIT